jgi:hypothetical protein
MKAELVEARYSVRQIIRIISGLIVLTLQCRPTKLRPNFSSWNLLDELFIPSLGDDRRSGRSLEANFAHIYRNLVSLFFRCLVFSAHLADMHRSPL